MTEILQANGARNGGFGLAVALGTPDPEEYNPFNKSHRQKIFEELEPWTNLYIKAKRIETVALYANIRNLEEYRGHELRKANLEGN